MLLGALAFISKPVTSTACTNIFPKVFGADQAYNTGGTQHTYLAQIDIYSDYLALCGDTKSVSLIGPTSSVVPYVAVLSMATTG